MNDQRYIVAKVLVDEGGNIHAQYLGTVGEQGGPVFKWGSMGFTTIDGALDLIQRQMTEHMEIYMDLIRAKAKVNHDEA